MSKNIQRIDGKGSSAVRLYDTVIVHINHLHKTITLNSGGYRTATTKRHMNKALAPLGWKVFQQKGRWYVTQLIDGKVCNCGCHLDFADGMELAAFGPCSPK